MSPAAGSNIPRATAGDYRFGRTCPICADPKTLQALRCRRCYADARRLDRPRTQRPTARCPGCGKPMWSQSRTCRGCWVPGGQPADHPWRRG